jgi:hypothetical protein
MTAPFCQQVGGRKGKPGQQVGHEHVGADIIDRRLQARAQHRNQPWRQQQRGRSGAQRGRAQHPAARPLAAPDAQVQEMERHEIERVEKIIPARQRRQRHHRRRASQPARAAALQCDQIEQHEQRQELDGADMGMVHHLRHMPGIEGEDESRRCSARVASWDVAQQISRQIEGAGRRKRKGREQGKIVQRHQRGEIRAKNLAEQRDRGDLRPGERVVGQ